MAQSLVNFSIETDSVVQLWFGDGTSKRVATTDLQEHLGQPDIKRIEKALKLRHSYFKRVLPPWMVLGIGLAVTIGVYDVARITSLSGQPESAAAKPGTVVSWDAQNLDAVSAHQLGVTLAEPEPVVEQQPVQAESAPAVASEAPAPVATTPAPAVPVATPAPVVPAPRVAPTVVQGVGAAVTSTVEQTGRAVNQVQTGLTNTLLKAPSLLTPRK